MRKITTLCAVAALAAAGAATGALAQQAPPSAPPNAPASAPGAGQPTGQSVPSTSSSDSFPSNRTGVTPRSRSSDVSGAAAGGATRESSTACKDADKDSGGKACALGQEKKRNDSTSARPFAPGQDRDSASGGERQ